MEDNVILSQNNPYLNNETIINTNPKTYKIVGIIERPASTIENYSAPGYTFITLVNEKELTENVDVFVRYNHKNIQNAYQTTAGILNVNEDLFAKYYVGDATHEETLKYINEEKPKEKYQIGMNDYLIRLETNP